MVLLEDRTPLVPDESLPDKAIPEERNLPEDPLKLPASQKAHCGKLARDLHEEFADAADDEEGKCWGCCSLLGPFACFFVPKKKNDSVTIRME